MGELHTRLNYLFNIYYNGTATPVERDELFQIITLCENDEELTALIKEAWNDLHINKPLFDASRSFDMLNNILQDKVINDAASPIKLLNKNQIWLKMGVAAAIMIFVGLGIYVFSGYKTITKPKDIAKINHTHDVLPGGNKAVLTLANGQTITLNNAQNGVLAKQGGTNVYKTRNGQLVYAAVKNVADDQSSAMNRVATPRGGQYQLVLNDGSKVWLNAASSLSFPAAFTGKTRDVIVTGEAYFEIAKNAAKPFRVKTNKTVVEVLGTHFNINAYNDEADSKTTLLEGSIKISNTQYTSFLKPGQRASVNQNGQIKVDDDPDAEDAIAWKNGIFEFRDAGIEAVMRQAARWYDVEVTYQGQMPERQFNGKISRNVKASELMGMLKYAGVNFKIEDRHITLMP